MSRFAHEGRPARAHLLALALISASPATAGECLPPGAAPDPASPTAGMVKLPGGSFTMGSEEHYAEEGPVREATVGPFWIDAHEVTNAEFAAFVAATGYRTVAEKGVDPAAYPGMPKELLTPGSMVFSPPREPVGLDDPTKWWRYVAGANWREPLGPGTSTAGFEHHPVVHVAWEDALAYARWLGRDLPTEAEWEYAARGGLAGAEYVWGETYFDPAAGWKANTWQGRFPVRNTREDGWLTTAPVGCFAPNGFGLYDMAGNVWELTLDPWNEGTGSPIPSVAVRGGSWLCAPNFCLRYRPSARQPQEVGLGSNHIGFRTVLRAP